MNDWLENVSKNIKHLKDVRGWSQDDLAENAGCSKSVVRDLEAKRANASVNMLSKIADALEVDIADLFTSQSRFNRISLDDALEVLKVKTGIEVFLPPTFKVVERLSSLSERNRDLIFKSIDQMIIAQETSKKKAN